MPDPARAFGVTGRSAHRVSVFGGTLISGGKCAVFDEMAEAEALARANHEAIELTRAHWSMSRQWRPYNEGYLYTGDGGLIPAKVIQAPWLTNLEPRGQDVSVVLESEKLGITRIQRETVVSTYLVGNGTVGRRAATHKRDERVPLDIQPSCPQRGPQHSHMPWLNQPGQVAIASPDAPSHHAHYFSAAHVSVMMAAMKLSTILPDAQLRGYAASLYKHPGAA